MDSNLIQTEQIFAQKYIGIVLLRNNTYLGREKNSGFRVIIKKFSFRTDNSWKDFKRLQNEIQILKRLNHLQVPKYLDSFQEENSFYLVQEYMKAEELSTKKVYLEKEIIDIAKQILSILIYLQGLNFPVIHHDLKPENILIDKEGKVYLVDFGISKEIKDATIGLTTQFGGTNGFIAPEKILGKKTDVRSDLYSLGVTLACLITKTKSSKAIELLNDDFELKKEMLLENNCSLGLLNWVQSLTRRKPENRFKNAEVALKKMDVLVDLNNFKRKKRDNIRDGKEAEKQCLETKKEEARNYLENVTNQILKFDDSQFLEQEVQKAIKHSYQLDQFGYPYFKKGDYIHRTLFYISFTVPIELTNKRIISSFIDLNSDSFGVLEKIGYWLSIELLSKARISNKAEVIKLFSLRSIFEQLRSLDTYPYGTIAVYKEENIFNGVDCLASLTMCFSYQKNS